MLNWRHTGLRFLGLVLGIGSLLPKDSAHSQVPQAELCEFVKTPDFFSSKTSKRDQLLERLGQSLSHLEGVKVNRAVHGLKSTEMECETLIQERIEQSLVSLNDGFSSYVPFLIWLARYQIFRENEDAALKAIQRLLELETLHFEGNVLAGKLYLERGQKDLALQHFRRVILVEKYSESQKVEVIFALRALVGELENLPDRLMENAIALQKIAGLNQLEKSRIVRLAIQHKLFAKAQVFIEKVAEPNRSLLELELLRARAELSPRRLELIRTALNSPALRAQLRSEGVLKLLDEWVEIARAQRDWVELKMASQFAISQATNQDRFLTTLEEAIRFGPPQSYKELLNLAQQHPTSVLIQRRLIEALLFKSVQAGVSTPISFQKLTQGELHAERLLALSPESLEGLFWKAYVLSKKDLFEKSELIFNSLIEKIRGGKSFQAPITEFLFWMEMVRVKKARGYTAEANALLNEAILRMDSENEKQKLEQAKFLPGKARKAPK
jgi:hypothetical protein